jgi:cytochrome b
MSPHRGHNPKGSVMKFVLITAAALAFIVAGLLAESRRNIEIWHGLPES